RVRYLHVPAYQKNISLQRLKNHYLMGRKLRTVMARETQPDVILCSYPTIEASYTAVKYGRENDVPVVLDIRDLWPDLFVDHAPGSTQKIARSVLAPYFRMSSNACAQATALCGSTDEFVRWGLERGGRGLSDWDRAVPFAYDPPNLSENELQDSRRHWDQEGIGVDPNVPVACFFGTLNRQFDFDSVIDAARRVNAKRHVQFVFCGQGEVLESLRAETAGDKFIKWPGWVNAAQIWALMQHSQFGLAPYLETPNFLSNVANKPIEYLAGGLPIVSSLSRGALHRLVESNEVGISYNGDADRLASQMLALLADTGRHRELVQNARDLFLERYSAEQVYGGFAEHLEAIAGSTADRYYPRPAA
ncbi:MAG: glycosyltransferase, partial [Lacipirellulaceae bacterium]